METKRCVYCQKLARAEAVVCGRCGRPFAEERSRSRVRRSIPPASPHHAGHYAGLHPEDQPYQSAFIPVPGQAALTLQADIQSPLAEKEGPLQTLDEERAAADIPTQMIKPRLQFNASSRFSPGPKQPAGLGNTHFIPVALVISCLILLVSGSVLAYAFINKSPTPNSLVLNAQPTQLRVQDTLSLSGKGFGANDLIHFIHDGNNPILDGSGTQLAARADEQGNFSVQVVVPADWDVGRHSIYAIDIERNQSLSIVATVTIEQSSLAPPLLALSTAHLDLGAAAPGIITKQNITLINEGGRQVIWQASSDQTWLSVFPNNGTFSGRSIVEIAVNRGILPRQDYTGHITFMQQGQSAQALILTVTMSVKLAPPASLAVSATSLTYQGIESQNPVVQTLTLQNGSNQAVDWSSTVITGNGANWLSISPNQDQLAAHSSETIIVAVQSQQLAPGSYIGFVGFKGGTNPVVPVALSVVAPGNLIISPPALNFSAIGQNPATQTMTIQNSGGAILNWSVSASTVDGANWLLPTPTSGSLYPGTSANIAVNINTATLAPRSYQGTITFSSNGTTKEVPIALTVSVPPAPIINVSQGALNFSTIHGTNPAAQTVTITNSGNAILAWTTSENQNGASFAPISPTSGSLNPAQSATLTVAPNVTNESAGTLSTGITIADGDDHSKVASRQVAVTIVIKDQAMIALSQPGMTFNQSGNIPSSTQLLVINNTGSQPLNWTLQASASWLSADMTSGTVTIGGNALLNIEANSTGMTPGTYTATLVVSDSDPSTPVTPQTVTVTMTVS
jgi:hypothetical protein